MTDDTANRNVIGLRRVLRAKAEEKARGVVSSNPPSLDRLMTPPPSQIAEAIARHERTPRDAFDVFLACADTETVYDFSSETKLDGDRYVITVTATPRKP